jgi:branched-chain amino acid transport system permease protein
MSAAQWRKAMNSGATNVAARASPWTAATPKLVPRPEAQASGQRERAATPWVTQVGARHVIVLLGVLIYPLLATPFFTFQIGGQALALGIIALSLTFLAGYGGMVSLAQMTVAGIAGYMVAIFGASAALKISLDWPWWLAVLLAIGIGTLAATLIGWLSVRTAGIYTIMITLAIGVAFYYLALQNYSVFNGFQGFHKVLPPAFLHVYWREPIPYYYLTLFWALAAYFCIKYLIGTPFGLALQGVRDNPRRMNSLGFNVNAIRVAAYALAGLIAAIGGVLLTWYNGLIAPGVVGMGALVNILIIAVLGGMRHPIGAFIGALLFVLLQNFAIDLLGTEYRDRFNLVIGGLFLLIVLFSPDGILGWWAAFKRRFAGRGSSPSAARQTPHSQQRR